MHSLDVVAENFATQGIIFIAPQYRLGIFGMFSLSIVNSPLMFRFFGYRTRIFCWKLWFVGLASCSSVGPQKCQSFGFESKENYSRGLLGRFRSNGRINYQWTYKRLVFGKCLPRFKFKHALNKLFVFRLVLPSHSNEWITVCRMGRLWVFKSIMFFQRLLQTKQLHWSKKWPLT